MRHDKKKLVKISEELTMFFFSIGSNKVYSEITKDEHGYTIEFKSSYDVKHKEKLKGFNEYFKRDDREFGAEEEYWALAGVGEVGEGSELLLIGMMVQDADIHIDEDSVALKLYIRGH